MDENNLPHVTIQLPVFNELYVVERLLDQVCRLNYPKHKLEIQVLDDSTDETALVTQNKVNELKAKGFDIVRRYRPIRTGFKAGALKEGLSHAKGDYLAIFDADFLPKPDFLMKTMPYFHDPRVGVVQTRWGHINKDYSFLTKMQAFALDAHFSVEQTGRNSKGYFINFNGTAGVWRKSTIIDAGNWDHDTLTEDLDLSYRAQLKGWKIKYLEHYVAPAELPVEIGAIKGQQFRWTKGGAENLIKNAKRLISSNSIPFKTKLQGMFHLFSSTIFVCVFICCLLSVPIFYYKNQFDKIELVLTICSVSLFSSAFLLYYFWTAYSYSVQKPYNIFSYLGNFILFLPMIMGLSFHNTLAVTEGLLGIKSSFIRTPKFNVNSKKDKWKNNKYISRKISLSSIIEGLLAVYFSAAVFLAFYFQDFSFIYFHAFLVFGFGVLFILSFKK